jgi:Holliday junction DNA helicase RuvB
LDRILDPQQLASEEDMGLEKGLRPEKMKDYIGQEVVKENLKVSIEATLTRGEALDHVLLYGPPGLGKTSMAWVISREMGVGIRITSGPVLERTGDLAAILTGLEQNDILFIDEIHRLNPSVEEMIYPAMEEFKLDLIVGQGPGARTLRLDIPRFTLIGATTRLGLLTSPLRNRFGMVLRLGFYKVEELKRIVMRSASILKVKIDDKGALEIARRSRGTPRIANRILKRVRDYAQARAEGVITLEVAQKALTLLEIDEAGFDALDRKFLLNIIEKFGGGPVGIDTLAASLGEERDTLEEVYEPYLIQEGYIQRTPRGRIATEQAYRHFSLAIPEPRQKGLPLEDV